MHPSLGDLSDSSFKMHVDDNDTDITQDNYEQFKDLLIEKLHLPDDVAEKITDTVKEKIEKAPEEAAKAAGEYVLHAIGASIMGYISSQYYKLIGKKTPEQIAAEERKIEIQDAVQPLLVDLEKNIVELKKQDSQIEKLIQSNEKMMERLIQSNEKKAVHGKFKASAVGLGQGGQSIV